jgi:hypothetical protein
MIKHTSTCRFMDKCGSCLNQNRCISATSVTSDLRKYFLKIMGQRQKSTPAMLEGKHIHEEFLKEYPSLKELGWGKFQKSLYLGEPIKLQELHLCSPKYGLHGVVDQFYIQFTKDNVINVSVSDLKPYYSKKYLKQLSVYGLCLSDKDCMVAYETITPRSHKRKLIANRLYPKRDFQLNIRLALQFYLNGKSFAIDWMKTNVMSTLANALTITIIKLSNSRKALHKQGIYYLDQLAPCRDCKNLESYCSLYTVCQKVKYVPTLKERQRYVGKNKLLVLNKPVIRR